MMASASTFSGSAIHPGGAIVCSPMRLSHFGDASWRLVFLMVAVSSTAHGFQANTRSDHPLLHDLIDDYRTTIALAQACLDRNPRQEIVTLCTTAVGFREEVRRLEAWSEQWYQTTITEHRDIKKEPVVKAILKAKPGKTNPVIRDQLVKQYGVLLDRLGQCQQKALHADLSAFCKTEAEVIRAEKARADR